MLTKTIRSCAYLVGAWLVAASIVLANQEAPVTPAAEQLDILKWAFTQGGLVIVTLVILWSYRRDFKALHQEEKARLEVVTDLVKSSTTALSESASAQREAVDAQKELTRAILQWGERGR